MFLQMASDKSVTNEILTWVKNFGEMQAIKVHLKNAFSDFDPSSHQTYL